MHVSIFLWGFTGILGRLIELQEGLLVWYRLIITSVILLLILLSTGRLQKLSLKETIRICLVGLAVTTHWLFFYGAIKYSNVSITLSCLASTALFTSVFEPLLNRSEGKKFKPDLLELFFALLAISGIYLVFAFQNSYGLGIVLALIASAIGALFTVLNKKLVSVHRPETVTLLELCSGLIFLSVLLPFYLKIFPSEKMFPNKMDWLYLFLLSFFCTIIPFILSLNALQKVSAFTINLSLNLEPIYGIILAFLVFGENKLLGWGFYAGTALILCSVTFHSVHKLYGKMKRREILTVQE